MSFDLIRFLPIILLLFSGLVYSEPSNQTIAENTRITHLAGGSDYFPRLLKLALEKTKTTHGNYEIKVKPWIATKQRMRKILAENEYFNLLWSTYSEAREKELLPVKVDLLKGLNQHRILLIHPNTQSQFDHVRSIKDLSAFTAISGAFWQDSIILKRNQLPVLLAPDLDKTIRMFNLKRADYFPRGVYEIWQELTRPEFANFELEKNLLLKYEAAYYFFVSYKNRALADRLTLELKLAQQDGSFDELFFSYPEFAKGWDSVVNNQRRVIYLN
ncbi:hypothetical protein XM47_15355 [Catenovulum maritimum]|uniref:Solute-binding protein family 3/N-terminal domain-containing protein n=1 Tax=Catenovulum maritimum TaxID=1513271 RepID=A0A0J8GN76_9ALTE|nr:hypothetical protein XM47_15355 [Catenovulum maritimum]